MKYGDQELTSEPTNLTLAEVASLLRSGHPVHVRLEPGDCTRYELLLVPTLAVVGKASVVPGPQWFWVMRVRLGGPCPSVLVEVGGWPGELEPLALGNDWTYQVLAWWWEELTQALGLG